MYSKSCIASLNQSFLEQCANTAPFTAANIAVVTETEVTHQWFRQR